MNKASVRCLMVLTLMGLVGCDRDERQLAADRAAPTPSIQATPAAVAPAAPSATCSPATVATIAAPAASPAPAVEATKTRVTTPAAPKKAADLRVKRLVVAQDIERQKREPVDSATSFKLDEIDRLYAFVEVENGSSEEGEVVVEFQPPGGGAPTGNVHLDVGPSPRWRTWAYTRAARKVGSWTAIVKNTDGEVLARTPFEVTL